MANITIGLSISSSNVLSTPLALAESFAASVDSGSLIRAKVKGTAADTNDMIVYLANDKNDRAYLYIQNLASELENYIYVRNETESDTALTAKIGGGEFAFIPIAPDKTHAVYATKVDTLIEYGVFGNDNSSVIFAGSGT
mgnify:FL=1|tara:strand:+ start:1446 stop:1865 length:420 start_codon:yes stop_codon:yes gene_type:complete